MRLYKISTVKNQKAHHGNQIPLASAELNIIQVLTSDTLDTVSEVNTSRPEDTSQLQETFLGGSNKNLTETGNWV